MPKLLLPWVKLPSIAYQISAIGELIFDDALTPKTRKESAILCNSVNHYKRRSGGDLVAIA
ncbi:MAG: hypothetical protein DMF76_01340 [Acidobacteria bacterium]|nr:MAG: hypothetical protein DMF76_01340 [Acidobacteriota bacterium]